MIGVALASLLCADVNAALTTWGELDTNARRVTSGEIGAEDDGDDSIKPPPDAPTEPVVADGLMNVVGQLSFSHDAPGLALRLDSAAGLKLFFTQASERMIVGQSRVSLATTRLPGDALVVVQGLAKFRAQRSGARTYGFGRGDVVVEKSLPSLLGADLAFRGGVSGTGFNAFESALFTSVGGGALVGLRASVGKERFDVFFDGSARGFPFALSDPSTAGSDQRVDGSGVLVLQLTSARRIFLSGSYSLIGTTSNAVGEDYLRHRLTGLVGFRLPALVTCTMQANVQLTQYSEGISIAQEYFLSIDDETQNSFEIVLIRPLIGGVYVKSRAAFYGNEFAAEGNRFSRQTVAIGIGADL